MAKDRDILVEVGCWIHVPWKATKSKHAEREAREEAERLAKAAIAKLDEFGVVAEYVTAYRTVRE